MNKIFIFLFLSNILIQYIKCQSTNCGDLTKGNKGSNTCASLTVTDDEKKKCIDNPDLTETSPDTDKACKEVDICEKIAKASATYDDCKDGYVDANTKKCVVNDDETGCKIATTCTDVKKGMTTTIDICGELAGGSSTKKCVRSGSGCELKEYCEKVEYTKDINCEDYPTTTDTKKCHKDGKRQ